jgi:hypothetical protein
MKNLTAFLLLLLAGSASIFAQSNLTSVVFNKIEQPALMLELPYNEEVSQDFIVASLKKTGYNPETKGKFFWKQNKTDGFYIFKDIRLEGLKQSIDLYFKVDQKGRRSKEESVIFMMVSKEEGSFISQGSDEPIYNAARKFLNGFVAQAAAYKLDLEIQDQEDVVKDAEKKLDKLQGNEKDLARKIEQLQKELNKNKDDQDDQEKTIDKEKKKLNELKAQAKDLK